MNNRCNSPNPDLVVFSRYFRLGFDRNLRQNWGRQARDRRVNDGESLVHAIIIEERTLNRGLFQTRPGFCGPDGIADRVRIAGMLVAFVICSAAFSSVAFATQGAASAGNDSVGNPETQDDVSSEDSKFFESKVRPLLIQHCSKCHGEAAQKGGLRLDSAVSMLAGGESGPAVIPGDTSESLLLKAVRYEGYEMPPSGRLAEADIQVLTEWVQRGAKWPGHDRPSGPVVRQGFSTEDRQWWAIQPVADVTPPAVADAAWCRNEVDNFIRAEMQSSGLVPAAEADRRTLIRRITFDLTGLPPSSQEIDNFLRDTRPDAWEHLVDRLLGSERYGERWARHWLDVVRYADSDGYRIDHYRPDAWRYRDYVIQSLNQDKPYDQFVQEQLAGDELFPENPDALIATGFLRHWIYEYNNRDARGQWDLILNEVTDTTGDVFLGLGMQCARCHDHKFDPILQKDYYRLRAFFESILPADTTIVSSTAEQQAFDEKMRVWNGATEDIRSRIASIERPHRDEVRAKAIQMFPPDVQAILTSAEERRTPLEKQLYHLAWRQVDYEYEVLDNRIKGEEKEQLLALRRELAAFDQLKPPRLSTALVVTDVGDHAPPTVIAKRGTQVAPGVLSLIDPSDLSIPERPPTGSGYRTTGRRAALAKWLTSPQNPLTARVIVNRIWQSHFGRGLAQNASDFGTLGGPPSHPQLLDWLTARLVRNGWKMKDLHRLIVTSATYRQASEHSRMAEFQQLDPRNQKYWRADVRRLDAEQIRDAVLMVSGQLDLQAGGPGVQSDVPRRSIYLRVMRNQRDPLLDVFDLPLFFSSTASRDTTTSPVQSLLLFNSQMMLNHAAHLAGHVKRQMSVSGKAPFPSADAVSAVVDQVWTVTCGRTPSEQEQQSAMEFLMLQSQRIREDLRHTDPATIPVANLPFREGQALLINAGDKPTRLLADVPDNEPDGEFTIEACFQLRSIYESGAVRTIAARWNGQPETDGWVFGLTGKGSRRKPQTLVLQMFGRNRESKPIEAALFSDHTISFNVPYFASVSVRPATAETRGTAVFTLKNLSNDDEPLSVVTVEHDVVGELRNEVPVSLGFRSGSGETLFDGLLDDVRWSRSTLTPEELLIQHDGIAGTTRAFWRFEPAPGLLQDSMQRHQPLRTQRTETVATSPEEAAFTDLCHTLLNSSEFLYVQ